MNNTYLSTYILRAVFTAPEKNAIYFLLKTIDSDATTLKTPLMQSQDFMIETLIN